MRLFSRTTTIDAHTAADLLAAQSVIVLDVRQHGERKTGHIKGAIHIPLTQLSSRQHELPSGKTIVTVCRSGHRSGIAARTLTRTGHDVLNLRGGMNAWVTAGLPLAPDHHRAG
ncbi:MAG TPA: rhodanese-like domain-containing protein [Gaiellaceae bacterium]